MSIEIYPLTIVADRYGGAYSDAQFLAFNLDASSIPYAISGGDMDAAGFWSDYGLSQMYVIGKGATPDAALLDLQEKLKNNGWWEKSEREII